MSRRTSLLTSSLASARRAFSLARENRIADNVAMITTSNVHGKAHQKVKHALTHHAAFPSSAFFQPSRVLLQKHYQVENGGGAPDYEEPPPFVKPDGPEGWNGYPEEVPYHGEMLQVVQLDPRFNTVPMRHRHIGYAVEKALKERPNTQILAPLAVIMRALSDDVKELLGEEGLSLKQFAEMYPRKFFLRLHRDEKAGFEIMLSEVFFEQIRRAGGVHKLRQFALRKMPYVTMDVPSIDVDFLSVSKATRHDLKIRLDRNAADYAFPMFNQTFDFYPASVIPIVKLLKVSDEVNMQEHGKRLELTSRLRELAPLLKVSASVEHKRRVLFAAANGNQDGGGSSNGAVTTVDPRQLYREDEEFQAVIASLEKMFSIDKEMIYLYAVPKAWRQHAMKGFEAFDVAMTKWRLAMAEYNKNPVGPAPRPNITGPRPPPSRIPILEGMDVVDALKNLTINPASFHIYAAIHPSYEYLEDVKTTFKASQQAIDVERGRPVAATPILDAKNEVKGVPVIDKLDCLRVARHLPVTSFMPIGELIGRAGHVTQQSMLHVLLSAPHYFRFEKDESTCGSGPKSNERGELQPNFKYLKSVQFLIHPTYMPPEFKPGSTETLDSMRKRVRYVSHKSHTVRSNRRGSFYAETSRLLVAINSIEMFGGPHPLIDMDVAALAIYDHIYERHGTKRHSLLKESMARVLPPEFVRCTLCLCSGFFKAYPLLFRCYELPPKIFVECLDQTTIGAVREDIPEDVLNTDEQIIDVVKVAICECQSFASLKGRTDPYVVHVHDKLPKFIRVQIKRRHTTLTNFFENFPEHFELTPTADSPADIGKFLVSIKGVAPRDPESEIPYPYE